MGRRYRRRTRISSVVGDVAHIASRLPWWAALLVGVAAYFLVAVVLGGFIESKLVALEGNTFQAVAEIRLGRLVRVCHWAGIACFLVGMFFAVRSFVISQQAGSGEKGLVAFFAKLLGRSID